MRDFPLEASPSESVIAPVQIDGLPGEIEALGRRWQRKVEFHVTVLAERVIEERLGGEWERVAALLAGRRVGPIFATREVLHVRDPARPGLETIAVMVECPGLESLYGELAGAFGVRLAPPPAHVTLYSTDPEQGIGLGDEQQLRERAPALSGEEQEEVRGAMDFDAVFGGGI